MDVALGALPFEERSIRRASEWFWKNSQTLNTCSAEDLVVYKAFAGRDRDWSDVESVLTRQHGKLDFNQVRTELEPLLDLKGDAHAIDRLDRTVARVEARFQ